MIVHTDRSQKEYAKKRKGEEGVRGFRKCNKTHQSSRKIVNARLHSLEEFFLEGIKSSNKQQQLPLLQTQSRSWQIKNV